MIIYVIIFLLLFASSLSEVVLKKHSIKRALLGFNVIILVLFASLRWTTGTDWFSYLEFFNDLDNYRNFEGGYVLLNNVFRLFSDNYTLFLLLDVSLAMVFVWYVLWKFARYPNTALLLFYSYYYLINYFGSNRRIIAIGLILFAGILIVNRKFYIGSLLILLASTFHITSCLFFLIFIVPRRSIKTNVLIIIYVCCFLVSNLGLLQLFITKGLTLVLGDNPVVERAIHYTLNSEDYKQSFLVNLLGIIKRSILFFLFLVFRKRIEAKDSTGNFSYLFNIYFCSVCIYILVNNQIDLLKVVSIYFSIFELLLIPSFLSIFIKVKERVAVTLLLATYMAFQFYSALFLNQYSRLYIPYYSIFSDTERSTNDYE